MTALVSARILPVVDDRDTGGFFEAARQGELVVRACSSCGTVLHMPRAYCFACGSFETGWRAVRGTGTIHSWTVVEHAVHAAYPVPYTVVLVALDDHPEVRFVGHLPGAPPLADGQPVEVWFEELGDGVVVPQWRPR